MHQRKNKNLILLNNCDYTFKMMGEKAAQLILEKSTEKIEIPFLSYAKVFSIIRNYKWAINTYLLFRRSISFS